LHHAIDSNCNVNSWQFPSSGSLSAEEAVKHTNLYDLCGITTPMLSLIGALLMVLQNDGMKTQQSIVYLCSKFPISK